MTLDLVRIGTRRSQLALYQTHLVADLLARAHPALQIEIIEMDTTGDKIRDVPLPEIGAKGLFTYELEEKLLSGDLELAVHSLKDLPSRLPEGLTWAGSPARGAATDCLVCARHQGLEELPRGALIATGSVRRRAQLAAARPDLRFSDLRGNIGTRLRKLNDQGFDAIVMATTALQRLELGHHVTEELEPERFVPAVGQGAIGLEANQRREDVLELLQAIVDEETTRAVGAERAFMREFEGGCSAPVAAYCRPEPASGTPAEQRAWRLDGWVGALDGSEVLHESIVVTRSEELERAGHHMAERFISQGARALIKR